MKKHLHFAVDLGLAMSMKKAAATVVGHGVKQAPVAEPVMLLKLEEALHAAYRNKTFGFLCHVGAIDGLRSAYTPRGAAW